MKVAIYIRVSDKEQEQGLSLEMQEARCRQFAEQRGFVVAGVWRDVLTGTRPDRPGYQAMLAARRQYDAVVVWRIDRFGRNEAEFFPTVAELTRLGKDVLSTMEPNGSPLVQGILAVVAAQESRNIGQRVKENMRFKAELGHYQTTAPFGYRWLHGELIVDPAEVAVYFRMVELAEQGWGCTRIARYLNREGYPARDRRTWWPTTVRRILTNPLHAGWICWGAVERVDSQHPRVIERDRWLRLQERLRSGSERPSLVRWEPASLLTGFVRCGSCGGLMARHSTARFRQGECFTYYFYRCLKKRIADACPRGGHIGVDQVEAAVLAKLAPLFESDAGQLVERARRGQARRSNDQQQARLAERRRLEAEIARCDRELDGYARMRALDEITADQFARLTADCRRRKEAASHQLAEVGEVTILSDTELKRVAGELLAIGQVWERASLQRKRWLLKGLGLVVTVFPDRLEFSWDRRVRDFLDDAPVPKRRYWKVR